MAPGTNLLFTCVFVGLTISLCLGFNLDTMIPVVKMGPENSYFGFSVAQHQQMNVLDAFSGTLGDEIIGNFLVIGAPILNIQGASENYTGGVYKCKADSMKTDDCELLLRDEYLGATASPDRGRRNQWLGVTVRSGGKGGEVVACAHRYKINKNNYGQGNCYQMSQGLEFNAALGIGTEINPCQGLSVRKEHEEYAYCQGGTGAYVTPDHRLIMGAPGAINWRGMLAELDIGPSFGIKRIHRSPTTDSDSIAPPTSYLAYLGYSVVGGKFDNTNQSYYLAGAPRSSDNGQVIFFSEMSSGSILKYEQSQILTGDLPFSGFGQDLIAVDLNNDGYDDLVVGCPFYFSEEKDSIRLGGAIYVYSGNGDMITTYTKPTLIQGRTMSQEECNKLDCLHGRFGFSLTKAGDLNRDSYQDFAVGAPYEGTGAVYIYHGSADGVKPLFSQRIYAEDLAQASGWSTFGYSLSGGLDLDSNSYPDLLVGSLEANKVAMLRTRPIIHLLSKVTVTPKTLNMSSTAQKSCTYDGVKWYCMRIKLCLRYTAEPVERFQEPVDIIYTIVAEPDRISPRVEFKSAKGTGQKVEDEFQLLKQSITGLKDSKDPRFACVEQVAYLKEQINDVLSAIEFGISYRLPEKSPPTAAGNNLPDINEFPILDAGLSQQETMIMTNVEFLKKCGDDNICNSNLKVDARVRNLSYNNEGMVVLDLGTTSKVMIDVDIQNTGEIAYQAAFYFKKPRGLTWQSAEPRSVGCQPVNDTFIECKDIGSPELGRPLVAGGVSQFTLNLQVDNKELASVRSFQLMAWANTTSVELSPEEDLVTIPIVVYVKADLRVAGRTEPDSDILYSGIVRGESAITNERMIGQSVNHTFTIYNELSTVVPASEVTIFWPYELSSYYPHGKHLLYLMQPPQVLSGDAVCIDQPDIVNVVGIEEKNGVNSPPRPFRPENEVTYNVVPAGSESGRRRREVARDDNKPAESKQEEPKVGESKKRKKSVMLSCDLGNVKCHQIRCKIGVLGKGSVVRIQLQSRLWESTLLEDFRDVDEVKIQSKAKLYIRPELNIVQTRTDNDIGYATTIAIPSLKIVAEQPLQWWIIALAIAGGILLLILLALCLWKLGFFKRQRYDDIRTYNVKLEKKKNIDNPTYSTKVEATKDYTDEKEYFLKR